MSESNRDSGLRALLPGALMLNIPLADEFPASNEPLANRIRMLRETPALLKLPEVERSSVADSLAGTLRRARYHAMRFQALMIELDLRREQCPGEVFWDDGVGFVHCEMQALCGAARLMVDEVLYIAARRAGIEPGRATRSPWTGTGAMGKTASKPLRSVVEVKILRRHLKWYRTLNAYRNAFFHNGWKHGSGHFSRDSGLSTARNPALNGLLVPDESSLRGRSKPFDWTWRDGTTVEVVVRTVIDGLEELLTELCADAWHAGQPKAGKIPVEEQPNVLVRVHVPAVIERGRSMIVPVFTSRKEAEGCLAFQGSRAIELVKIPLTRHVLDEPSIPLWLGRIGPQDYPEIRTLHIVLDPHPQDEAWSQVLAEATTSLSFGEIRQAKITDPLSVQLPPRLSHVYLWRSIEGDMRA